MAFSDESVALITPAPVLSAHVAGLYGELEAPAPVLVVAVQTSWVGALKVPLIQISSTKTFGWRADISAPAASISGKILTGGLVAGNIHAPACKLSVGVKAAVAAAIVAGLPSLSGRVYAEIAWDGALIAATPELACRWPVTILDGYDTWVVNTKTGGHSTYTNYNFNSFFRLGGSYYGCAADGIYLLEGASDAGTAIEAAVTFGASNLGTDKTKRIDSAYPMLRAEADGAVEMRFAVDGGDVYAYQANVAEDTLEPVRIKTGRGVSGRYWTLELRNVAGAKFAVYAVKLVPVLLSRRV